MKITSFSNFPFQVFLVQLFRYVSLSWVLEQSPKQIPSQYAFNFSPSVNITMA